MSKAGISIPLTDLSGSTIPMPTTAPVVSAPPSSSTGVGISVTPPIQIESTSTSTLSEITAKYGKDVAGFISRINQDWVGIKSTYKLPAGARLA
jgi:hypothetical protein